jgi:hypothetical protein
MARWPCNLLRSNYLSRIHPGKLLICSIFAVRFPVRGTDLLLIRQQRVRSNGPATLSIPGVQKIP